jgi:hypothetical protein
VTLRPSFENPIINPRLAPYRHRAAEFRDGAGKVGTIYVEPQLGAAHMRGHLWWRQWERAREHVILWIDDPTLGPTDAWIMADDLDEEIDHWERHEFAWIGNVCELTWLDAKASREMSRELDIDHPGGA